MTVILVLSTFIVFLLIDHFFSKKHVQIAVQPAVARREPVVALEPSLVGGFKVPENLRSVMKIHPVDTMDEVLRIALERGTESLEGVQPARWVRWLVVIR